MASVENQLKFKDYGEVSSILDEIIQLVDGKELVRSSEAETRFKIIDRIVREICQWKDGQVHVEERIVSSDEYVDYILRHRDFAILIEAKRIGAAFPTPTRQKRLRLQGSILSSGEVSSAIKQAEGYADQVKANLIVVTNGECWCLFKPIDYRAKENESATILFPLASTQDCERLFNIIAVPKVEEGSIAEFNNLPLIQPIKKLNQVVKDSEARLDRNNIADFISPALDAALYSESILNNSSTLEKCFVSTEGRKKFDSMLQMHLVNPKPSELKGTSKIKKDKNPNEIDRFISQSKPTQSPPVTLLIGNVGVGKSTFLRHFELVRGRTLISSNHAHWVYIDFEQMGDKNPRSFLYQKLLDYLNKEKPENPTDFKDAIEPAYEEEIKALARGPFYELAKHQKMFKLKIQEIIGKDYEDIEPYVDKVYRFISHQKLTVIVLDNIDLYEDSKLETKVFSEAIALAKKLGCYVFVSIRDTTFVEHKNDSIFNAYELRRLWLEPPPFGEVLSKRFGLAKKVLENVQAKIPMSNGIFLDVPDLSVFFEIVQRSLLGEASGHLIEYLSDRNIRKGLQLVTNFLTSGHIQADTALKNFIYEDKNFTFKIHEVFKGAVLGQWKYYKEERAEIVNLFDSKIGSFKLLPLRIYVLNYTFIRCNDLSSHLTKVREIIKVFSNAGASEIDILETLNLLQKNLLIKNNSSKEIEPDSEVYVTLSGGYHLSYLSRTFCYLEAIMNDTPIYNEPIFEQLSSITFEIEHESKMGKRLHQRVARMRVFLNYLSQTEANFFEGFGAYQNLKLFDKIKSNIDTECENLSAIANSLSIKGK